MPLGAPGKRRRKKNVFTNRAVGYVNDEVYELVLKAAQALDESLSEFVAKAVESRARSTLKNKQK